MSEQKTVNLPSGSSIEAFEISPGTWIPQLPPGKSAPYYGYLHMVSVGGGRFEPRVRIWSEMIVLTAENVKRLGIGDINIRIIRRLGIAGMVDISDFSPGTKLLNVASLMDHIEAAKDPEFWTPKRREAFRQATLIIP